MNTQVVEKNGLTFYQWSPPPPFKTFTHSHLPPTLSCLLHDLISCFCGSR